MYEPVDIIKGLSKEQAEKIAVSVGLQSQKAKTADMLLKMYDLFVKKDALLIEINPYAEDAGEVCKYSNNCLIKCLVHRELIEVKWRAKVSFYRHVSKNILSNYIYKIYYFKKVACIYIVMIFVFLTNQSENHINDWCTQKNFAPKNAESFKSIILSPHLVDNKYFSSNGNIAF